MRIYTGYQGSRVLDYGGSCRARTKMTLHRYFKKALPTPEETGLTEKATREANQAVAAVLQGSTNTTSRKRSYLVFSDEQRATIGQYAAVNGNAAVVKKFKEEFDSRLGESTVRKFKRYYEELKRASAHDGCDPEVS